MVLLFNYFKSRDMIIKIILTTIGSNAGPLLRLTALPYGTVFETGIAKDLLLYPGRDYTVPNGTEFILIENIEVTGYDGVCEDTILPVTPITGTTTTTTTGGATPPTTSTTTTGTTSSTSSTTTTSTTHEQDCEIEANMTCDSDCSIEANMTCS
jgi:hypothetical protein